MSASAKPPQAVYVKVSTLLRYLATRRRHQAETAEHAQLQAQAEGVLAMLVHALGALDEDASATLERDHAV